MAPSKYLTEIAPGLYKTKGISSSSGRLEYSEVANTISNPFSDSGTNHKNSRSKSGNRKSARTKKKSV